VFEKGTGDVGSRSTVAWLVRRARGVRDPDTDIRCILRLVPDVDITVRLQPRAKRNAIVDERDGVLRVSVAAAPVDGQANAALCKLIAKRAGIARGRVSVVRGERSREKVVRVEGLAPSELRRALVARGELSEDGLRLDEAGG
jgi:uncharacterized protein (TIGR00251 family)